MSHKSEYFQIKIQHSYFRFNKWHKWLKRFKNLSLFAVYLAVIIFFIQVVHSGSLREAFASARPREEVISQDQQTKADREAMLKQEYFFNIIGNRQITEYAVKYSEEYKVDTTLLVAVMKMESGFNPNAINANTNGSIDRGLCQLNNNSFTHLAPGDFFDPQINIMNGSKYLQWTMTEAKNNLVKALAYYNAGIGSVSRKRVGEHTLNYINNVINEKFKMDRELKQYIQLHSGSNAIKPE